MSDDDSIARWLFRYSEWLDQQGLVVSDDSSMVVGDPAVAASLQRKDKRTHEELVHEFMVEVGI